MGLRFIDRTLVIFNKSLLFLILLIIIYLILVHKVVYFFNTPWNWTTGMYTFLTGSFLLSRFLVVLFYEDDHKGKIEEGEYPGLSVVIACKNEEEAIKKTISAALKSDYPGKVECIAVDDGSTDKTLKEMIEAKNDFPKLVQVISFSENRGKREAMAMGVLAARYDLIVFVDSDSFLKKDALKQIVRHFIDNPKVGAVAGKSLVENNTANILTRMQSARYDVSFDVFKSCESVFGTVTCCPGCFSAYRKEAILKVIDKWRNQKFLGSRSTFGDDRSLTNFVLRDWKVIYCSKALVFTIVPENFIKFLKQQVRWKKSWVREGTSAAGFIWRKHPFAAFSFYTNLLIPIFGPVVLIYVFFYETLIKGLPPTFYILGVLSMSLVFGISSFLRSTSRDWFYVILFTFLSTFILIWQMPYALFKIKDNSWGTR